MIGTHQNSPTPAPTPAPLPPARADGKYINDIIVGLWGSIFWESSCCNSPHSRPHSTTTSSHAAGHATHAGPGVAGQLPKDPTSASVPPLPSHSRPVPPPQSHTAPAPLPPPLRNNVESGRATHARTAFGRAMPWRVNAIKPAANYVGDGYW